MPNGTKVCRLCLRFLRNQLLRQILRTSEVPKKHQKGPCSRDKKIAIICKACGREMPNGTEIMSMFPTESAAELDTQNIKVPKQHQNGPCGRDKKIAIICKACGREMPNGTKLCVCFLGNQLLSQILRTSEVQKNTKRYLFPKNKKIDIVCKACGKEMPNVT